MVRKLLKHEAASYIRSMLPMWVILVGIAVITRFVQFFESDTTVYSISIGSTSIVLGISVVVCFIMSIVVSIKRYYVNMFTSEGYLTMTLPVTAEQHLFAKILIAFGGIIATLIIVLCSLSIAVMGELFIEIIKAINYIVKMMFDSAGWNGALLIAEIIIAVAAVIIYELLLFYACISVGQLARKNRILAAFGAYFAWYIITQIFGTIFVILFAVLPQWLINLGDAVAEFSALHPILISHIAVWLIIVWQLIFSVLMFFISRYIIKNKLNLE